MSDPKLERLRQLMKEEAEKKNGAGRQGSGGDNASYPYWKIPPGSTATIRFLPDKDDQNPWFWVERQSIRLSFNGTIGGDSPTDNKVTVTVPCVDMFGETCPIIAETKPWWKDDSKKETARAYYKRRSYITQGFVVSSPFDEPTAPENPIRRFVIGKELVEKLKSGMADPEMEYLPTDFTNGTDFKIRLTTKSDFNNYATSEWSRRTRSLSENEAIAMEQHGLFNLADFRGMRPDNDAVAAIKAMFHASLKGEPYDYEEFGKYFRPYGSGSSNESTPSQDVDTDDVSPNVAPKTIAKVVEEAKEDTAAKAQPSDILAKLRERTKSRSTG